MEHITVTTNGINMHVASTEIGPVILFLHHQPLFLSSHGYRCIVPDLRGYGDTYTPASPSEYTRLHIVSDLVGLLDSQRIEQVYLIGHDWGPIITWHFCLFRRDRIKALVNTSIAFVPRSPQVKPVDGLWALFCDEYYIRMFQDLEEAKEQYSKLYSEPAATVLERFFTLRDPNLSGMSNDLIHTEPGVAFMAFRRRYLILVEQI